MGDGKFTPPEVKSTQSQQGFVPPEVSGDSKKKDQSLADTGIPFTDGSNQNSQSQSPSPSPSEGRTVDLSIQPEQFSQEPVKPIIPEIKPPEDDMFDWEKISNDIAKENKQKEVDRQAKVDAEKKHEKEQVNDAQTFLKYTKGNAFYANDEERDKYRSEMRKKGISEQAIDQAFRINDRKNYERLGKAFSDEERKNVDQELLKEGLGPARFEKIDKRIAENRMQFSFQQLTPDQRKLAELNTEFKQLQDKDNKSFEERQRMDDIQVKLMDYKNSPKQLYDPTTGSLIDAEKASPEAIDYEKRVASEADRLRKSFRDKLTDIHAKRYAELRAIEQLYDQPVRYKERGVGVGMGQEYDVSSREIASNQHEAMPFFRSDQKKSALRLKQLYEDAKASFDAVNRALLTNEDPANVQKGFLSALGETLAEEVTGNDVRTERDYIENYVNTMKEEGAPITIQQEEKYKRDLSEKVGDAIGASIPLMVELAATTMATEGLGSIPEVARIGNVLKAGMEARFGRAGVFAFNVLKEPLKGAVSYGLAPGKGVDVSTGIGEGLAQGIMDNLNIEKLLGGKYGKLFQYGARVLAGTAGETIQEFSGDYLNALSQNGYDYKDAFEKTFGRNMEDFQDKLAVIALTSAMFSSSFNLSVFTEAKNEIEAMPDSEKKQELLDVINQANPQQEQQNETQATTQQDKDKTEQQNVRQAENDAAGQTEKTGAKANEDVLEPQSTQPQKQEEPTNAKETGTETQTGGEEKGTGQGENKRIRVRDSEKNRVDAINAEKKGEKEIVPVMEKQDNQHVLIDQNTKEVIPESSKEYGPMLEKYKETALPGMTQGKRSPIDENISPEEMSNHIAETSENPHEIASAYLKETSSQAKENLASRFKDVTGIDLDEQYANKVADVGKKVIADNFRKFAEKIRSGKIEKDIAMVGVPFAKEVWNGALEVAALTMEKTGDMAQSISDAISHIKESDWFKGLNKEDQDKAVNKFSDHLSEASNVEQEQTAEVKQEPVRGKTKTGQYIQRRLKDLESSKEFRTALEEEKVGEYTPQSMRKANAEADKLISEAESMDGGLDELAKSLDKGEVPSIMRGPVGDKLILKYTENGDVARAVKVAAILDKIGREAGRTMVGLRSDASPESTISRIVAGMAKAKEAALSTEYKSGATYQDAINEIQAKLDEIQAKYDKLLKDGSVSEDMGPVVSKGESVKKRIERAKQRRKKYEEELSKILKAQRSELRAGFKIDPELIKVIAGIFETYLDEAAGNVQLAFQKLKKNKKVSSALTEEQIESIKKDIIESNKDTIDEFVKMRKQQAVEEILKPSQKETLEQKKARKEAAAEIVDKFDSGAKPDEFSDALSKVSGFKTLKPEQLQKIMQLTSEYSKLVSEGKKELAYNSWYDLMTYMSDLKLMSRPLHETMLDFWYTGVLSGLTTISRSIKGSGITTSVYTLTRIMASPKAAPLAISLMIKGMKGAGKTYWNVLKTGITKEGMVNVADFKPSLPRMTEILWNKKFNELGIAGKIGKAIWFLPTFSYRNIIAFDQILKDSVSEAYMGIDAFSKTDKNKKIYERVKEAKKALVEDQNTKVNQMVDAEISQMKSDGEKVPYGYKARRFQEIKNDMRDHEMVKKAIEDAGVAALVGNPTGWLGKMYESWTHLVEIQSGDSSGIKAGKLLMKSMFPFMRVALNFINAGLDYAPVVSLFGQFKSTVWTKHGNKKLESHERRELFIRAALAHSVLSALLYNMFDYDDEKGFSLSKNKDRSFDIYGPMTGKWWEEKDVAPDAKPYSIRVKNPFTGEWSGTFQFRDNPLGFVLAPIAIMHDEMRFKDFEKKIKGVDVEEQKRGMGYLLSASTHGTFMYAMSQSFNQGFQNLADIIGSEDPDRWSKNLSNLVERPLEGFYPSIYKQLYNQYKALMDIPEKQDREWYQHPAKMAPLVDDIIKNNKYDVFGYPIVKQFDFPLIPDIALKMAKDNLDYRENYKEWKLLWKYPEVVVGGFLAPDLYKGKKLDNDQKDSFMRLAGERMRYMVDQSYSKLNKMEALDLQQKLQHFKEKSREYALKEVVLKGKK